MTEQCKSCRYHKYIANTGCWACHYCIETGNLRDCDPEDCTHWQPKTKGKRKRVDIHLVKEKS